MTTLHVARSLPSEAHSADPVLGSTEPRLSTAPLREDLFTNPEASYGHGVIAFAVKLGTPLDPWEEHAVIRAGELLPDGSPRFRRVLIIVARQNGKTFMVRLLTLYWLVVDCWEQVYATSNTAANAKKQWLKVVEDMETHPFLKPFFKKKTQTTGMETLTTVDRAEYCFGAANGDAGRSFSIDRLVIDELRQHHNFDAWDAAYPAMNAKPYAQAWCITNQGSLRSEVLNYLRDAALKEIEAGDTDGDICLLEWSAPDGSSPIDPAALAAANPNLGRRLSLKNLVNEGRAALQKGGMKLAMHLTEYLCMKVATLDAAIDAYAWREGNREPGDWAQKRSRLAMFFDVNPVGTHVTLCYASVLVDDLILVEVVKSWATDTTGTATQQARAELRPLLAKLRPQKLGWLPKGPAASMGAYLAKLAVPGCTMEPVVGDQVADMCMGFAERVLSGEVVHQNDQLFEAHVLGAAKYRMAGDRWTFMRGDGTEDVDAAYAAAGAVQLALTLPKSVRPSLTVVGQ
jgi:phage terminase large subunit-like protein